MYWWNDEVDYSPIVGKVHLSLGTGANRWTISSKPSVSSPPQSDPLIAAKFVTNAVLMDERFEELACLLIDGNDIGGMEGEPGWIIERRDTVMAPDEPHYKEWPAGAAFRFFVDPDSFQLGQPDVYLTRHEFHQLVRKAIDALVTACPSKAGLTAEVTATLSAHDIRQ